MSERPKKKKCSCNKDMYAGDIFVCQCGYNIWNACIDAWKKWEKENPRLERLDEGVFNEWFAREFKIQWLYNLPEFSKILCNKFGKQKDAVHPCTCSNNSTVEEIAEALCPIIFGIEWENTVGSTKSTCRRHARTIHSLITRKLKGQDNEDKTNN